jgi:hypothetical protein
MVRPCVARDFLVADRSAYVKAFGDRISGRWNLMSGSVLIGLDALKSAPRPLTRKTEEQRSADAVREQMRGALISPKVSTLRRLGKDVEIVS